MNGDNLAVAKAWFQKADNDMIAAEQIMRMDEPPTDTVCFHAQQCAEKYLKGLLTFHQIDFPRTHSLEDLAQLCQKAVTGIAEALGDLETLSSYGVEARYPGDVYYEIPVSDAEEALSLARCVRDIVLEKMPRP